MRRTSWSTPPPSRPRSAGARFCTECKTPVAAATPKFCSSCGAQLPAGAKFCSGRGSAAG
ncbi:MAG: zinc ribbon domain-containing protein [Polyangiaceae bacterium]|nr:zinc ribbon domain-containing protein [Polyangiaceae bacterium]